MHTEIINITNLSIFLEKKLSYTDVDGNGVWDADEVKALFIKELDKLYGPGGPNKDMHERAEEMERMREHVFKENDKNRDGLIDFHEFMQETQRADFNQDEGKIGQFFLQKFTYLKMISPIKTK